jgi:hypothetical protein
VPIARQTPSLRNLCPKLGRVGKKNRKTFLRNMWTPVGAICTQEVP